MLLLLVAAERQSRYLLIHKYSVKSLQFLFQFFLNSQNCHHWHFCATPNGNKSEIVTNEMNLNTKIDLLRPYSLKIMSLVTSCNSFSYLSNTKMSILPTSGVSINLR